ncbi:TMEMX1 [Hibiscus syriacus]|uniref:TMEMX1 n=1 Tax=Hibiscus syriacus TaxID=106335 RepID=A0A6A2XAZ6_HIBSY|nr:uncharacterized protein LOC120197923 isoform X2 [Hibiscus syriacus]KAE8653857.1 TMEMX1 [Hibiscus syriacus]
MGSLGEEDLAQMEILKHTNEEANIQEKVLMYLKDMRSAGHQNQTNNLKKLIVTKLRNDGFEASLCKTSWLCTSTHYKGAYEYIDVMVVENGRHKRVIVDIDFRPQFELARPTVRYKEMISNTPLIFVGSEEKLKQIIPLLCSAAKTLKENGLHVPPWRKHAYMHSKWLSKNCKKVSASPQDIDSVMRVIIIFIT